MDKIKKQKPEKVAEQGGQVDAIVTLPFFEWLEKYTPLKSFWEKQNNLNIENGSENYPYEHFKEVAKGKLIECIRKAI